MSIYFYLLLDSSIYVLYLPEAFEAVLYDKCKLRNKSLARHLEKNVFTKV